MLNSPKKKVQYYMKLCRQTAASRSTSSLQDLLDRIVRDDLADFFKVELVRMTLVEAINLNWVDGLRTVAKGFRRYLDNEILMANLYLAMGKVDENRTGMIRECVACIGTAPELSTVVQYILAEAVHGRADVFEIVKPLLKSQEIIDHLMKLEKSRWDREMVIALLKAGATYDSFWKRKITNALREFNDVELGQVVNAIELARELEITEGTLTA